MFSMPPPTATSSAPDVISCAADRIACAPEPHTRFTVTAGTDTGSPAWIAAWRPGFILEPAWITFPITTVPISPGSSSARDAVLRPVPGAERPAHDPVLHPHEAATASADDHQ